jgi:hypothetical protein
MSPQFVPPPARVTVTVEYQDGKQAVLEIENPDDVTVDTLIRQDGYIWDEPLPMAYDVTLKATGARKVNQRSLVP